jgi:hypothetical protein
LPRTEIIASGCVASSASIAATPRVFRSLAVRGGMAGVVGLAQERMGTIMVSIRRTVNRTMDGMHGSGLDPPFNGMR